MRIAAIGVILRSFDEPCLNRVSFDITAAFKQMGLLLNRLGFVPALKNWPCPFVSFAVIIGISTLKIMRKSA
jgi:hypothetical protein